MVNVSNDIVICDKLRLNQVLLNVLSNAIKYTQPGRAVRLVVTQKCKPIARLNDGVWNGIVSAAKGDGSQAAPKYKDSLGFADYEFVIEDTGIGMSPEFLEHVFEPFERESTSTVSGIQGTGLGLAITKRIVDLMGGTITASSDEGEGSKFVMSFRFDVASSMDEAQKPKKAEPRRFDGKHILLVEDNELNLEIAKAILERAGFAVSTAGDGTIAVKMVEEAPAGTYDLVLTDVQMPKMDGYEETRVIRAMDDEAKSQIPIVAMTANAFEEDRAEALAAGMNGYVHKPINVKNLMEVLSEQLGSE